MEDGIENADRHAFVDMCGQKEDDIYLSGMDGVMYHFGGKRWTRIDSPTSSHIYSCLYVSEDEIYIGGSSGSLFVGGKNGWNFIGHENMVENVWCIEAFNGNIYAAYSKCIKRCDGDTLEVVNMNFEEQPSVHRLTATSLSVSMTWWNMMLRNGDIYVVQRMGSSERVR